jgi:hypothetical protein
VLLLTVLLLACLNCLVDTSLLQPGKRTSHLYAQWQQGLQHPQAYLINRQQLQNLRQHQAAATDRQLRQHQRQRQPQGKGGVRSSRHLMQRQALASAQLHRHMQRRKKSLSRTWYGWQAALRKLAQLLVRLSSG